MYKEIISKEKKLAVIGLGYVGLPIALEFAKKIAVIGFESRANVDFCQMVNSNLEYMHYLYSFFIDCDHKKIKKAFCSFPIQDEFEEVLLNRIWKAALK